MSNTMNDQEQVEIQMIQMDVKEKFGINLEKMEQIVLHNQKQYFKLYDPNTGTYRMILNTNSSKNLSEQFKEIQQVLISSQSLDGVKNAEDIYQSEAKFQRKELTMIPVSEMERNYFRLNGMDSEKRKCIDVLVNYINFERIKGDSPIRFINFEEAIAIDNEGKVISAEYNPNYTNENDKVLLFRAQAMKFNTYQEPSVDSNDEFNFDIPDEYFDQLVETIDMSDDIPVIIEGEQINKQDLQNYYQYPEMVDKDETLTKKRKYIIVKFIQALSRKTKVMTNQKANQKVYSWKRDHQRQSAFVNNIFMAVLAGIVIGVVLTLFLTFFRI